MEEEAPGSCLPCQEDWKALLAQGTTALSKAACFRKGLCLQTLLGSVFVCMSERDALGHCSPAAVIHMA